MGSIEGTVERTPDPETDLVKEVIEALAADRGEFAATVERERERLKEAVHAGTFDNARPNVGFEYEFYGTDRQRPTLVRIPRRLLDYIGWEKELGVHNAEMQTTPQPLNAHGIAAQEAELKARVAAAADEMAEMDMRLVSDALLTVPPRDESIQEYLSAADTVDGVRLARNLSDSVRYHALSNAEVSGYRPRLELDAPNVSTRYETAMPESLICSVQPHYQVPIAADLPRYFRYALRVAGPLLAATVNSPFFPPELYDDVPAERIVEDAHMEHRIGVFESTFNPASDHDPKVTFPPDFESVEDAIDHVADDHTIVPTVPEKEGRFDDRFRCFRHKHGSYWRWVRPVFEAPSKPLAHARIELRAIPAQPTVRDAASVLATFAGALTHLPEVDHPVADLPWEHARENLYAAARDGLRADLHWVEDGDVTVVPADRAVSDLLDCAGAGLRSVGLDDDDAAGYLRPLRARVERGVTPARFKHDLVRKRVETGADVEAAVYAAQSEYVARQARTLVDGSFPDWLD